MRSKIAILFSEAAHRRGFSRDCMIDLSLPLHPDWTGGLPIAAYLDRLVSLGITGVEVQLPPVVPAADLARWTDLVEQAWKYRLKLAIHAPFPVDSPMWLEMLPWIARLAAIEPLTLIVHSCTASRPHAALVAQTINHVRALLSSLPPSVIIAVEQGWNWGALVGLQSMVGYLRHKQSGPSPQGQRPIRSDGGMNTESVAARQPQPAPNTVFDPQLPTEWQRMFRRTGGFSGTGSREATLEVVMEVNQPNCIIAWDVAHDWLGGAKSGVADWRTTPAPDFLSRVGYVRLHDVDDNGHDHWPLVIGNVPYTSQLRPLMQHGFAGTVCLAIRYTPQTGIFGDRWHVLERSLAVARQVLRLPYPSNV